MAYIYITEHAMPTVVQGNLAPVLPMPPIATQKVVNTGASAASSAFNARTKVVCVHTDSICSIAFGTAPTAAVTDKRMAANTTEYFEVTPGHKIAAVLNT